MSLGTKIQEARKKLNITQEQLADMLDVTRQSVSRWESDVVYPDMEKIVKLSNILEVSCDYLLKNEEIVDKKGKTPSRLLLATVDKNVELDFYDDEFDMDLIPTSNKKFKVLAIEGEWMKIEITKTSKKEIKKETKLVSLNTIQSIKVVE